MRCTDCHKIVKPVVAIDIDGTLGNYHDHLTEFAEGYLGISLRRDPEYDGATEFWEWFRERGIKHETYRQIKLAYRQGGLKRTMPTYPYAASLTRHLRALGAEVWLCTTRPYLRLDNVDPDTRFWLEHHGIEYDGLLYGEDKYIKLAEIVGKERVVGVLDDLPEMHDQASLAGLPALQISRKHNAANVAARTPSVVTLHAAAGILVERVELWMTRHSVVTSG